MKSVLENAIEGRAQRLGKTIEQTIVDDRRTLGAKMTGTIEPLFDTPERRKAEADRIAAFTAPFQGDDNSLTRDDLLRAIDRLSRIIEKQNIELLAKR